ncbi:putative proline--tRNA ligase AIM10 KNAG_0J01320 [Huiozyma naganishii CBS 8797]|uniref:proline--tRNA ligase n=1 Tax=Huiozyma naganishii (strain ATCC MYA-139 / BCRC 22969 / CBS 8797 / KCTC 17520 / NBRC 10181 / NCYC 3082 / Yp74L-3) TaxID=1071383 RepID=J7RQW2_HUIN7|nr:hypothetical protein KNAG_0J01320 [Kazachstania naganishii CBS 8797]CCK72213.1 hypothetical protein KNAG_0J01320 [Kazachstania naganishii CBS 8797]
MKPIIQLRNPFQQKFLSKQAIATLSTPELLQRLNFVQKTQSGLFHYLPLSLRILNKITGILDTHLQKNLKAQKLSLSTLSSKSLWSRTERWSNTELFKLKDSKSAEFCLVATCEEDVTELMRGHIDSYKNMPCVVYQTSRKYRDERRPRGGLLRGKEFLMMDAYSFASTAEESLQVFNETNRAYDLIFKELKVPYVKAWADNGDMGGDISKEYHLVHESGEDTIFSCSHCKNVFNEEMAESSPLEEGAMSGDVNVKYALTADHSTLICFYFPADRQINWNNAVKAVDGDVDKKLRDYSNARVLEIFQERSNEDIMFSKVLRVMDCRINSRSNFPDFPLKNYLKNNFGQLEGLSIVNAVDGEKCGSCEEGALTATRSIEVGHTFVLGTKYSELMNLKFKDKDNQSDKLVEMGCYGIGVTRIIGAIAEVTRDEQGIRWPSPISPYLLSVCSVENGTDERVLKVVENLSQSKSLRDDIMQDFSNSSGLGSKIQTSHALGIPLCIIIGSKSWPRVEIEVRGKRWCEDGEPAWIQEHERNKSKFDWDHIPQRDDHLEKHIVSHMYVKEVVEALLKDI